MLFTRRSLKPMEGAAHSERKHLNLHEELTLALLPTVVLLAVMGLVETFSQQRLLFASLGVSAFLIYLDPHHGTNQIRTLILAQMLSALLGFLSFTLFGPGYVAVASAMLLTILLMVLLDAVHPPAIATTLGFAYQPGPARNLLLFALAVGLISVLVLLQQSVLAALSERAKKRKAAQSGETSETDIDG